MAVHFRAYRLRCYPTSVQRLQLARLFGAARWVWNRALEATSKAYSDPELNGMFGRGLAITPLNFGPVLTQLKREPGHTWLTDCDTGVLAQALRDLQRAYANFFSGRARHPRFRKKGEAQSVRFLFHQHHPGKALAWDSRRLVLPQLGEINVVQSRWPTRHPKMVTVRRDSSGRYWVSMAVAEEICALPASPTSLGVDVGVKDLAVLSDGTRLPSPKKLAGKLRHLRRLSRSLSRKKRGSARWRRQRHRLARLQARIADARRDALHQASTAIVSRAGFIALETLNVAAMMKNPASARSVADAAISELHRQLEYKAKWYGRQLVRIGRFVPSSQLCSACGHRNQELKWGDRRWCCPACGATHDRDLNAARNILAGGLRITAGSSVGQGVPELMRVEGEEPPRRRRPPADRGRPAKREPVGPPCAPSQAGSAVTPIVRLPITGTPLVSNTLHADNARPAASLGAGHVAHVAELVDASVSGTDG